MKGSKRIVLVALGVAVAGGLVALLLALRGGGAETSRQVARWTDPPPAADPGPSAHDPAPRARPEVEAPEEEESDAGPRVYVRDDGKVVRDHRSGNPEPMMTGGVPVPEKMRKIQASVIYSMRKAMRPLVYACAEEIDTDALGDDPMIQSEVMISIEDGAVTVDQVAVKLRDIETEADELSDCVRTSVADLSLTADGHEDVSRYWLTMPFKLRR